jgi:hypothetical protein
MRRMLPLLASLILAAAAANPALPSFHEAFRREALAGDPGAAAACYAGLLDEPSSRAAAGLGLARCLERLDRRAEAAAACGWVLALPGLLEEERAGALAGIARNAPDWLLSTERSPDRWTLSKAEVRDAVAGAFRILSEIKIEPYLERDGLVGGLLLRSVGDGSLPARRGLKPYDLIRRINGRPLTSTGAQEILSLLGSLKDEPVVEVEIERLGTPLTLRYEILPDPDLVARHGPFPRPAFTEVP